MSTSEALILTAANSFSLQTTHWGCGSIYSHIIPAYMNFSFSVFGRWEWTALGLIYTTKKSKDLFVQLVINQEKRAKNMCDTNYNIHSNSVISYKTKTTNYKSSLLSSSPRSPIQTKDLVRVIKDTPLSPSQKNLATQ